MAMTSCAVCEIPISGPFNKWGAKWPLHKDCGRLMMFVGNIKVARIRMGTEPRPRCVVCGSSLDLAPLEGDLLDFYTSGAGEKYAGKILACENDHEYLLDVMENSAMEDSVNE